MRLAWLHTTHMTCTKEHAPLMRAMVHLIATWIYGSCASSAMKADADANTGYSVGYASKATTRARRCRQNKSSPLLKFTRRIMMPHASFHMPHTQALRCPSWWSAARCLHGSHVTDRQT